MGAVVDVSHCTTARELAQEAVDADTVGGNQYLSAGRVFEDVFATYAWCGGEESWVQWGRDHLGPIDGSVRESLWWSRRWSRENPANNYYHSFMFATSVFAMATNDEELLDWLKTDRLPKMYAYYSTTPEGGSREGTAYGESHREVLRLAKLWRDYDGTEIVPQSFIDGTLMFWTHAVMPGGQWMALMGDQTRTRGKTDGYHADILDNALILASDPEAIEAGRWTLSQIPVRSSIFTPLFLTDHPEGSPPKEAHYHAKGAGVLFRRDSWEPNATAMYFTAGIRDEAHQCEDQGGFAVWADGQYQTVASHAFTRTGLCNRKIELQNVMQFPGVTQNERDSESSLTFDGQSVRMDLTPAGYPWERDITWGDREIRIIDTYPGKGEFGFHSQGATATSVETSTGRETTVRW